NLARVLPIDSVGLDQSRKILLGNHSSDVEKTGMPQTWVGRLCSTNLLGTLAEEFVIHAISHEPNILRMHTQSSQVSRIGNGSNNRAVEDRKQQSLKCFLVKSSLAIQRRRLTPQQ